jgi:hypothetical protein
LPDEKHGLIVTYSLAHTAMIHLHRTFALSDAVSFEKCSQASRACISVVKHISDGDFAFLEPIIGVRTLCFILPVMHILNCLYTQPCWWSVADILVRDLDALRVSWPLADHSDLRNDLAVLMYAMNRLGGHFPLIGKCMYLLLGIPCLPRMSSTCSSQDPEAFSLKSVLRIILDQWTHVSHVLDIFFRLSTLRLPFSHSYRYGLLTTTHSLMTLYTTRTTYRTLYINLRTIFDREIIGLCTFKHIIVVGHSDHLGH